MRTLGVIGLVILLVLVLVYQSYFLTEGFGFGIPSAPASNNNNTDSCGNSVHLLGPGGLGPQFTRMPLLGPGGLGPESTRMPSLGPGGLGPESTRDATYAPYKASAADRKQQRAKLLRDIQKIVHNEIMSDRATTDSRYPSDRRGDCDYEDSCDNSPALQQGCEMEDTCN